MSQHQALVCQYVENLSSATFERYRDILREMVHRRHGVYALYRGDKLYYVGLATNLRSRVEQHLKDRHKDLWDRFSVYLTIDDRHLRELESLVVRIAQPKGNKQSGKFTRSENLLRTFRRRVKERQRSEYLELIGWEPEEVEENGRKQRDQLRPLQGLVGRPRTLRATYKGTLYKARARTDGTIRVGSRVFDSPSTAAAFITKRPVNGWGFWRYERAPGQWVRLRELRQR